MSGNKVITTGNVAIVLSMGPSCDLPPAITIGDLLHLNGTIQLPVAQSSPVYYDYAHGDIRRFFGSWIESGDEDEQLDEIYRSRFTPARKIDG